MEDPALLRTAVGSFAGAVVGAVAGGFATGFVASVLGASGWTGLGLALAGGALCGVVGAVAGVGLALSGRAARRATLLRAAVVIPVTFVVLVFGGEELLGASVGYPPPQVSGLAAVVVGALVARWTTLRGHP